MVEKSYKTMHAGLRSTVLFPSHLGDLTVHCTVHICAPASHLGTVALLCQQVWVPAGAWNAYASFRGTDLVLELTKYLN